MNEASGKGKGRGMKGMGAQGMGVVFNPIDYSKGNGMGLLFIETTSEGERYLQRVVDEVLAVLFDSRRQSCHGLVLNNFVSCSGFKQLLARFKTACDLLFQAVSHQEAVEEGKAQWAKAKGMAHLGVTCLRFSGACACPSASLNGCAEL